MKLKENEKSKEYLHVSSSTYIPNNITHCIGINL